MLLSKLSEKIIWINCQFPTESRNISTHLSTILNRLVCNKTVIISEMLTQSNHQFKNLNIYFKNWKHSWFTHYVDTKEILSPSYSVFVKLSLCLRERADTLTILQPPHHSKLLRTLELSYTEVWYIIGIVSPSPTEYSFPLRKNRVN